MPISLKDKVVLITGASSGFGQDAANLFAQEGCKLVLAARRLDRLQTLSAQIQRAGGEAVAIPVDVVDRAEIQVMVETTLDLYGQIDILFNNAGFGRLNWLESLNAERDIETQVQVNLLGTIQTTRAVLPYMLTRESGHIINMVSVAGLIASPLYTVYSATKFGVRAFTDSLRREVAPFDIHVTGVYPGLPTTEFGQHVSDTEMRRVLRRIADSHLTSEYVAKRVVGVAKRPVRNLIIPWWYRLVVGFDMVFPAAMDWILKEAFVNRFHKYDPQDQVTRRRL